MGGVREGHIDSEEECLVFGKPPEVSSVNITGRSASPLSLMENNHQYTIFLKGPLKHPEVLIWGVYTGIFRASSELLISNKVYCWKH